MKFDLIWLRPWDIGTAAGYFQSLVKDDSKVVYLQQPKCFSQAGFLILL